MELEMVRFTILPPETQITEKMNLNLHGKTAIVCGSTQGIGRAIAIELASLGANIVLFARNAEAMAGLCAELASSDFQKHTYLTADFQSPDLVKEVITEYINRQPTVHILVNNSGGPPPGPAFDADSNAFLSAFSQHLISNQQLVQAVVPSMKKTGYGRIINIISVSVRTPIAGLGVSNTIRGAVASWAKTLSVELGPFGITVNNVLPGYTSTERLNSLIEQRANDGWVKSDVVAEEMKQSVPLRRFAEPSETAALTAFLASPSAAFISGESIRVDGGATPSI
jgi:3-oxoacyl-[acyl-carrier protein] reductase